MTAIDKFPRVRVTRKADDHAQEIVDYLKDLGLSVSKTGWISELILSQPIPAEEQQPQTVEEK